MRAVLDTNVFISGIFFSGPPSQILIAWKNRKFQIVFSQEILDEYQRVAETLAVKFPSVDIIPIIELVTIHGRIVDTKGVSVSICDDHDDNKFIECAIADNDKIIISGDKHLLKVSGYQGLSVLKPRDFVDRYLK